MSPRLEYAPWFDADVHLRMAWYADQEGPALAERFLDAVEESVRRLASNPQIGHRPFPKDPDLAELHAILVKRPFNKHILYYRFNGEALLLERLIHGARDLPRRLRQSP